MKKPGFLFYFLVLAGFFAANLCDAATKDGEPKPGTWITSPQEGIYFQNSSHSLKFGRLASDQEVIRVDAARSFQVMDGFGNCLTDGSAMLIHRMTPAARKALLTELFARDRNNIGISYLRITLGASDLSDRCYSYDDMPDGQQDMNLEKFSIAPAREHLVPVLKEILQINPRIKILASPWSAPVWMKDNKGWKGGSLVNECFDTYARYFCRYIKAMLEEGIRIDAITIQNEPLHPGNTPSMYMPAEDQAQFIGHHLGPQFRSAGIDTKIIVYDHNADKIIYPLTILRDPVAAPFVDGSAFHLYAGKIEALSDVHNEFPGKNLYFTEQWVGAPGNLPADLAWHTKTLVIGASRNWCKNVIEWNMASDPAWDPHTQGGCDRCLGTITLDGDRVTRNPAYFILAHSAKFVVPGSVRIASDGPGALPNVAFVTPGGRKVLIVLNDSAAEKQFGIAFKGRIANARLAKGAVGTFVW